LARADGDAELVALQVQRAAAMPDDDRGRAAQVARSSTHGRAIEVVEFNCLDAPQPLRRELPEALGQGRLVDREAPAVAGALRTIGAGRAGERADTGLFREDARGWFRVAATGRMKIRREQRVPPRQRQAAGAVHRRRDDGVVLEARLEDLAERGA